LGLHTQSSDSRQVSRPDRLHLLLVEDDDDTRDLMALALTGAGFDVDPAASGREALDLLAAMPYDLLVTDYDMPGMTGTEMLQIAAKRGIVRAARSLIVTAHPSPKGTEGFPVVRKPLDLGRFVALLRSLHAAGVDGLRPADKQPN
jgi:two-component system OmpR family response regulator